MQFKVISSLEKTKYLRLFSLFSLLRLKKGQQLLFAATSHEYMNAMTWSAAGIPLSPAFFNARLESSSQPLYVFYVILKEIHLFKGWETFKVDSPFDFWISFKLSLLKQTSKLINFYTEYRLKVQKANHSWFGKKVDANIFW